MTYHLITFANTHSAMAAKSYLKDRIICQVMPTLREISDSCGISLRVQNTTWDELRDILSGLPLNPVMYTVYHVDDSVNPVLLNRLD